jgi:predicted phage-related endonuclease
MAVRCEIKGYNEIKKQLKALEKAPSKVMNSLTNEAKKRVPGWVATTAERRNGGLRSC